MTSSRIWNNSLSISIQSLTIYLPNVLVVELRSRSRSVVHFGHIYMSCTSHREIHDKRKLVQRRCPTWCRSTWSSKLTLEANLPKRCMQHFSSTSVEKSCTTSIWRANTYEHKYYIAKGRNCVAWSAGWTLKDVQQQRVWTTRLIQQLGRAMSGLNPMFVHSYTYVADL